MKHDQASKHKDTTGDAQMAGQKKKSYSLHFVLVEDRGAEIARNLARREIEKVFAKYDVVCENWDEVLPNHMSGEMRNDKKHG
jgi:hypothetical protein